MQENTEQAEEELPEKAQKKEFEQGKEGSAEAVKKDEDAERLSIEAERQAHIEEFTRRTGMSPRRCYRLVLLSLTLRLLGGGWVYMVMLEYTRHYVINDLKMYNILQTVTGSPQMILQAFLFPVWGVVSDRVSRKKVLVAATLAFCLSNWLLTLVPCVEVFILTKVLNIIVDIGNPIRDAMLRDIFSKGDWESHNGGATGIKSRMALLLAVASGMSVLTGLGILQLGNMGLLLPNEYTLHKEECKGHRFCVPPGQFSWDGNGWHIDGCLRLLMVMGTSVLSVEALVVIFFFPETIRPENRREHSIWQFFRKSCRDLGWPWDNLRVFATPQLRTLMGIRFVSYVVAAGGTSMFIAFYRRFDDLDTFKMTVLAISAGAGGWFTLLAVPRLVDRFGDMLGVWIPGNVLAVAYGVCLAFLTPGQFAFLIYVAWPVFAGPSSILAGLQPELISKLIPPDVQGTFQTGKSFIFRMSQAIFMWPWTALVNYSEDYPYPLDGLNIWGCIALGVFMLVLTVLHLRSDPRKALSSGRALDDFYESPYAQGPWYKHHGGSNHCLKWFEEDPEEDDRTTRCELPTMLPVVLTRASTLESIKLAAGTSPSSFRRRKTTSSLGSAGSESKEEKITITVETDVVSL